jgi:hypothetical protein
LQLLFLFWNKQQFFLANSHLLSFVLPMIKLSNSINCLEYELMIMNLWETCIITSHPYCLFLYAHRFCICLLCLWCLYALSSWSNYDWHVSEASIEIWIWICDLT